MLPAGKLLYVYLMLVFELMKLRRLFSGALIQQRVHEGNESENREGSVLSSPGAWRFVAADCLPENSNFQDPKRIADLLLIDEP
jgi:hypothetical protein